MKAVIFDLDGTLIDSLKDIALCMNDVLNRLDLPTHPLEAYNYFVGDGALILAKNALPKNSDESLIQKVFEEFKILYDQEVHHHTKPYEGITELLGHLEQEGISINVLSNKPHQFTLKYVNTLLDQFNFHEVHGQKEDVEKKPDPAGVFNILKRLDIEPCDVLYVGDTATDMKTAKAANLKSVGVAWGFRPIEELIKHGADHIVHHPSEIFELLKKG